MKKRTLFAGLFLLSVAINAQEVISTQGDSYSNATNTVDFTIGEPVIATVSDGTNDLTQGFHQTLLTITSVEDFDANFSVNIFPNPTANQVNLTIDKYQGLIYQLYDVTGKLLIGSKVTNQKTQLNVSDYPKGTYLLSLISQDKKKIKTYKIIKK
jgi:Secretion system C-terminal sorting domain